MVRRSEQQDISNEVWIVFADVLVGFLAIILLVSWHPGNRPGPAPKPTPSPTPSPKGPILFQPPAIERLTNELQKLTVARANRGYEVSSEGFEVHIVFEEGLLFDKCKWALNPKGQYLLTRVATVIWLYDPDIGRIQIEGHADKRRAESCTTLAALGNIGLPKDNLLLSSLRAMVVQQELAQLTTSNGTSASARDARLAKLEAVGKGAFHPRAADPQDPKNRRIEITVHFASVRTSRIRSRVLSS